MTVHVEATKPATFQDVHAWMKMRDCSIRPDETGHFWGWNGIGFTEPRTNNLYLVEVAGSDQSWPEPDAIVTRVGVVGYVSDLVLIEGVRTGLAVRQVLEAGRKVAL